MSISINYSGRIKNPDLLPELIEKMKEIAEVHNWERDSLEDKFPGGTVGKESFKDLWRDYKYKIL